MGSEWARYPVGSCYGTGESRSVWYSNRVNFFLNLRRWRMLQWQAYSQGSRARRRSIVLENCSAN